MEANLPIVIKSHIEIKTRMELNILAGTSSDGQDRRGLSQRNQPPFTPSKRKDTKLTIHPSKDTMRLGKGRDLKRLTHQKNTASMVDYDRERESTPDQDDLKPEEEQEEAYDVQRVLEMTMSREAKIKEQMNDTVDGDEDYKSDEEGPRLDYGSDRDEGYVSFAGQATFSMHSRKEAKKARRPKFERSKDAVVQVGSLSRAGNAAEAEVDTNSRGFMALGVSSLLSGHLQRQGYVSPTVVQSRGIPSLLEGKDVMIESPTGSGKTLTYLIPIFEKLHAFGNKQISRSDGTLALILCPTRELCLQVLDMATIISRRFAWIVPGSIHGGENRSKEKARLRKGVNVLISTPGRLYDHLVNTASFKVSEIRWLVLDEADRLLDMGFKKQISSIMSCLREKSAVDARWQIALFSATLHGIQDLLTILPMKSPVSIKGSLSSNVGDSNDHAIFYDDIPKKLIQRYIVVPCKFRFIALFAALKQHMASRAAAKVLVFLSNCDSVDFHQVILQSQWNAISTASGKINDADDGVPAIIKLHGNMSQIERTRSLLAFTKESRGILLATDVASRGLDFPQVSKIIQYDAPTSSEEYVHRVGRTARFGKSGESLLFVVPAECGFINYLHSQCGLVSLEKSDTCVLLNNIYGVDPKAGKSIALELHRGSNKASLALKTSLAQDRELTALAEMAFTSSVRAYATHSKELKDYFRIKNLHLGHYANSFGLKETPMIAGKHGSKHNRGTKLEKESAIHKASSRSRLTFSQEQGFNRKWNKAVGKRSAAQQKGPHSKKKSSVSMYVSS